MVKYGFELDSKKTLKLTADSEWCKDDYKPENPKYKSRITMAY